MITNLENQIQNADLEPNLNEGVVVQSSDGVVWARGLTGVMFGEVLEFESGTIGLCLNIETDRVGIVVLGDYENVKANQSVATTGRLLTIGVSDKILGRVIDPLGNPLDDKPAVKIDKKMPIENEAASIIERSPVNQPLQTGILTVDALTPIGRGQRQLIIGDRSTGKSTLAIDTIINQKEGDVICVYVAIGQKRAKVAQTIEIFNDYDSLKNTVIVNASASDPASLRYLAPYSGCAISEYFMQKGKDVLVIYDDLTKHAWSYRELSLLLRRPSGREAYPGDIFYLHSRLLERAAKLNKKNGGGSITALPIIETQQGDVSAYIPTNVISITDGQINLDGDLFFAGVRPAMNVGLSVSRVGGAAQVKAMKKIAGKLRLDLSQFNELATFAQFATDLDKDTKEKIERGKRLTEILKQSLHSPMEVSEQIVAIFAATDGLFDEIEVANVKEAEEKLLKTLNSKNKKLTDRIEKTGDLTDKDKKIIRNTAAKVSKKYKVATNAERNSTEATQGGVMGDNT